MCEYYCYCDKCGKPVERSDFDEDGASLCQECARELYQKIFGSDDQNKK